MIIVLKAGTKADKIKNLMKSLESQGVAVSHFSDVKRDFLGLIGDTSVINTDQIRAHHEVEQIIRVEEPFKRANRKFHPENSIITIGDETIGGERLGIIAGPCSVESEEQIIGIAKRVKKDGANFLRGGGIQTPHITLQFSGIRT